ncbi:MAG: hypothetical protein NVS1B7_2540 [Candidatus Saccharimonadales bacterium]
MYYRNRAQAGKLLAHQLKQYATQNTVVIAMSQGSIIVGAQIAMQLHANLLLHLIKSIYLPGEIDPIAGVGSAGTFGYNNAFSAGQLEDMVSEFRSYIEQKKFETFHDFNVLLGDGGEIDKDLIRHRNVILVSDGLANSMSLDLINDFFKTIAIKRIIIATPLASVAAVDKMHLMADEIHCLSVPDNFMKVDHYYEDNTLPDIHDAFKIMRNIAMNWQLTSVK